MTALFLDAAAVALAEQGAAKARALVRRAKRWTTKAESVGGQSAHRALHEAEQEIDRVLSTLRGDP